MQRTVQLAGLVAGTALTLLLAACGGSDPHPVADSTSTMISSSPSPSPTSSETPSRTSTAAPTSTTAPSDTPESIESWPLTDADMTNVCHEQLDADATAKLHRTSTEPPSDWWKCYHGTKLLGGLDLNRYCRDHHPGSHADNPVRDSSGTEAWEHWRCLAD